ncbi:acyl-CoA dehydrogenase [Platysternon megacephalum]|uniref:Acyl-CoA dehydrogenase n=1 Tax=Platysternon megacephalum TaxID=55544 RepID=A0A4D9DCR9_9SAUR|nr:acyl-CoA dehydrogenase [Platysternon megacephalum]
MPALELRNVAGAHSAPCSLTVAPGEIVGLISNDGAQPEQMLDLISGHSTMTSGTIFVQGNALAGASARARADLGLVRGHADPRLWGALTVEETLRLLLHRQRKSRRGRSEADYLTATLSAFGLDAVRDARMDTAPLGVRRIVELAALSCVEPSVMLLEQPTSGLPSADVEALVPQLQRLASSQKLAIIVVDSDRGVLGQLCHRIAWFDDGHLREVGNAADVITHAHIAVQKEESHE